MRALLIAIAVAQAAPAALADSEWSRSRVPSPGPAEAIGGYSRGCVKGAIALPKKAGNLRVARPARRRHFGHPQLVSYLRTLAAKMKKAGLGRLYVGDLSQPRGGPAPSGHASHQTGLDADLWYLPTRRSRSVIDRRREKPSRHWNRRVPEVLRLAASDPRVARIFVHPVIKRTLCRKVTGKRDWLRKLRPWWGHDSHFHVRLSCPSSSSDCEDQPAIADGDGCAEVEWWFSKEAKDKRAARRKSYQKKVGAAPTLPERCAAVAD
ncbi:MAG: penicillin-insensitive murein endopeptidase [Deltaproteobacteria bacterium]|nr:penicillin-insensitive murein endopeptidase [Deltaproteobacteria bacterium]